MINYKGYGSANVSGTACVKDTYGRSGKVPELLELYGLTAKDIVAAAKRAISLKK